jgi:uncharacterized protein (TIGR03083 family)
MTEGDSMTTDAPGLRAQVTRFLASVEADGRALLTAAEIEWTAQVPACPDWDVAALVRHQGGIFEWMAAIVTSGERVTRRTMDPPPELVTDLSGWYRGALSRVLSVLGTADPATETWTFSSLGDRRVWWWCRRLAIEVAVHRWDAEQALAGRGGSGQRPLADDVAAAGIEEYLLEFLPGMSKQEGVAGFVGSLQLEAPDGSVAWWVDLAAPESAHPDRRTADVTISATASDLLLWLNNRVPSGGVEIVGDQGITGRWEQLQF